LAGKYWWSVTKLFVYSTDEERCEPMMLRLGYWEGNETSHFDIEYYGYFNPKKWDDDIEEEWFEITKDEYMQHYAEVQKRISLAVSAKNNMI